jgi:glycosyltransferase involved in cell wall biosynthesis
MTGMDASVIIPTHNRCKSVLCAVHTLLQQDCPLNSYEIIISCDRCGDGTDESLQSTFGNRVKVVKSDFPGQAGALNTGLRCAQGHLAIMLDDEMEADKCLVSAHVGAHKSRAGAKIAVTGYSPVIIDSTSTPYARMVARDYESYFAKLREIGHSTSPTDLCGCNFSLPVHALQEAGGFNEEYSFQRNDFELAIRLLRLGYEIHFCRAARADQRLAITADIVIGRTAERAQNDCRLARDYPWCVRYLPFYRVLTTPSVRRRWRVLWEVSRPAASLFGAARRIFPKNLRLANLEYATRYCMGLRQEINEWHKFCSLAASS